jgi:hypothetical protein
MADQHNANIPALINTIASDIPDIKENLEFHKDTFQLLFETWSDTDNSSNVLESAFGWSDGTYTYDFPTNGIAGHAVIMLGNSSTIIWLYLNAAPPGWKALTTGADTVLGVAGGTGDYNVNGGNADSTATWVFAHTHKWYDHGGGGTDGIEQKTGTDQTFDSDGATGHDWDPDVDSYVLNSTLDSWRPSASVGKLFQLDTA